MQQLKPGQFRKGKTQQDRINQAARRNASNKQKRAEWENDPILRYNDGAYRREPFPYDTCNGKKWQAIKYRTEHPRKRG